MRNRSPPSRKRPSRSRVQYRNKARTRPLGASEASGGVERSRVRGCAGATKVLASQLQPWVQKPAEEGTLPERVRLLKARVERSGLGSCLAGTARFSREVRQHGMQALAIDKTHEQQAAYSTVLCTRLASALQYRAVQLPFKLPTDLQQQADLEETPHCQPLHAGQPRGRKWLPLVSTYVCAQVWTVPAKQHRPS